MANINIQQEIKNKRRDAILYKAEKWLIESGEDPYLKTASIKRVAKLISFIKDSTLRTGYIEKIATGKRPHNIKTKLLTDLVSSLAAVEDEDNFEDLSNWDRVPKYMSREELEMQGFCEVRMDDKTGYYGWGQNGKQELSNFIIKPLFHVPGSGDDSRHIFEVSNSKYTVTMDVASKVFISVETFQASLVGRGAFLFYGNKNQLMRISTKLLPMFPVCDELKELGWQPEGFFAYVDSIYVPPKDKNEVEVLEQDQESRYGLKKIGSGGVIEILGKHFLVPAASSVFQNMREDLFESQRVITYKKSPVDFGKWATKMKIVYGDHGLVGLAFLLCSLFRDILSTMDNNFPHLYAYGERSSGKSKMAESLYAFIFKSRSAFSLNSGTDFAFFQYVKSFKNCLAWLNEFDDKDLRDEWFQSIKGFFDLEGRQRGRMGSRPGTETQKAESGIILTGQFLSTKDDNSVVTRSIVLPFHERQFTQEETDHYNELKQWQEQGLSSLLPEVLQYRSEVKEHYYEIFNATLGEWRRKTTGEFNSRIFQNHCHLASMWKLMSGKLALPVSSLVFEAIVYKSAKEFSNFVRSSDTLNEFWNTVSFLQDEGKIIAGWDFRIETWSECKLRKGDGEEIPVDFGAPKKLLIMRLNNVHQHYQKAYKDRTSKPGMTIDNLKHYFSARPYYLGQLKQIMFKKYVNEAVEVSLTGSVLPGSSMEARSILTKKEQNSSAYVFDYDLLGCNLDHIDSNIGG